MTWAARCMLTPVCSLSAIELFDVLRHAWLEFRNGACFEPVRPNTQCSHLLCDQCSGRMAFQHTSGGALCPRGAAPDRQRRAVFVHVARRPACTG